MQKCFIDIEKSFSKATLVLLFLSILTLAAIMTPVARAQSGPPSISLFPTQGPAGTLVSFTIYEFSVNIPVTITFYQTNVGTATPKYTDISGATADTSAGATFTVPAASLGTYTVTATGSAGEVATTTFTVTQAPSATPTPSVTPTGISPSTPIVLSPTNIPVTVNSGFWSPLAIALTAVVIAFAIFITAVYVRRGKQKTPQYQEVSPYEPRPSTPSKPNAPSNINQSYQPYQSSRVNQSYQPYQSSRVNQTATNIQQPHFTRVCRHCKRTVRDDLNICPYCSKRLK